jgi:hypothetical protein
LQPYTSYKMGFELIIYNGALSFLMLLMISKKQNAQ